MKKLAYLFREMGRMIRRHKMWFFAPILIVLVVLSALVYYLGPAIIAPFVYAGL